jgi:hypothetical protein
MVSQNLCHNDICSECGAQLSSTMRHCPTCRADAGAPNVRRCRSKENLKALAIRFDAAQERANTKGCLKEFFTLLELLERQSGVVVSMPARVARDIICDPRDIYVNYEALVGASIQRSSKSDSDQHRCSVAGRLFGSYAHQIIYGVLSLNKEGLPTYGDVHCRLRSITINKRTSFLETNSYRFVENHQISFGGSLPLGYMACWNHRHRLVLAKLADSLLTGQVESDWQGILIHSDGKDRKNDDYIEAHIYEGFDRNAIESMTACFGKKMRKEDKLDLDIAIFKFKSFRQEMK